MYLAFGVANTKRDCDAQHQNLYTMSSVYFSASPLSVSISGVPSNVKTFIDEVILVASPNLIVKLLLKSLRSYIHFSHIWRCDCVHAQMFILTSLWIYTYPERGGAGEGCFSINIWTSKS